MSFRDVLTGIGLGIGFFIGQTAAQLLFAFAIQVWLR